MAYARLFLVNFEPLGRCVAAAPGANLLDVARRAGIELAASCNGQGDCGGCWVAILEGQVSALTEEEERCQKDSQMPANHRLACCVRLHSAARIMIPQISQADIQRPPFEVEALPNREPAF